MGWRSLQSIRSVFLRLTKESHSHIPLSALPYRSGFVSDIFCKASTVNGVNPALLAKLFTPIWARVPTIFAFLPAIAMANGMARRGLSASRLRLHLGRRGGSARHWPCFSQA